MISAKTGFMLKQMAHKNGSHILFKNSLLAVNFMDILPIQGLFLRKNAGISSGKCSKRFTIFTIRVMHIET